MNKIKEDKILISHLKNILQEEYNIIAKSLCNENKGFDINTATYKVKTAEQDLFLKIRINKFAESSLMIPYWLSAQMGIGNIVKPIKTNNGMYYVNNNSMFIALYPYINGKNGWAKDLSKRQFTQFGDTVYSIHSADVPKNIQETMPRENYDNEYRNYLTSYFNQQPLSTDGIIKEFNLFVTKHNKKIISILDTANILADKLRNGSKKYCLCHGDLHAGNLIITGKTFYIVDWDTIILAPKEKDLMFIGGGIGNKWNTKKEENNFYKGYADKNIDHETMLYYRCERILIDFKEFHEQIKNIELCINERKENLKMFKTQFEQNNVIDITIRNIKESQFQNVRF